MEKNIFLYIVDCLKKSDGYINVATLVDKEFGDNDIIVEDIIEKLLKYNLIDQTRQSKWTVRKKQSLVNISQNKLIKIFEGKSLEKPKWQTIDFYMNESIKYLIGAVLGIIVAYITYKATH